MMHALLKREAPTLDMTIRFLIIQMGGDTGGMTLGFLGPFLGFLVIAAIGFVLWNALNKASSPESQSEQSDDALETLRRRYARGDIDEDTFEKRERKLRER